MSMRMLKKDKRGEKSGGNLEPGILWLDYEASVRIPGW